MPQEIAAPVSKAWGPDKSDEWAVAVITGVRHEMIEGADPETWRGRSRTLTDVPCVLLYRGLDCSLEGADCEAWGPTEPVIWERSFDNLPYTTHMGEHRPHIRLWLAGAPTGR